MPSIGPDDAARHPGQVGSASSVLFEGLVDDASMFPPRSAPADQAVRGHQTHQSAWYHELVGPLVINANHLYGASRVASDQWFTRAVRVSVVAPDGPAQVRANLREVIAGSVVEVVAVELPLASVDDLGPAWAELGEGGRAVWWEVDREGHQREQLGRLAGAAQGAGLGGAKLRTGGLGPAAVPGEDELAAFLRHAVDLDLSFKLTAGLHHAVRGTDPGTGLEHHGVLNILCALKAALNGAEPPELAQTLALRDEQALVTRAHAMSAADASVIRAFWSSFGCCDVTEPIGELARLGLLEGVPVDAAGEVR